MTNWYDLKFWRLSNIKFFAKFHPYQINSFKQTDPDFLPQEARQQQWDFD